jgi:hypothetical protein
MADTRPGLRARTARILCWLGIVVVVVGVDQGQCRADRITLRGGGQIRGKVLPDPQHPDRVKILTESGKTPLSFQKTQIVQVVAEPSILDEYLSRRAKMAASAQANYELGLWCEEHKLKDLAELHYEAALSHDPYYESAHLKLGHVLVGDRWISGDQLREAQGLVRYRGQWISKEEKEKRVAAAAKSEEQSAWARRLKLLRQSLVYGSDDRRRDAEQQMMEIRDPLAVIPLLEVFGGEGPSLRILLDHVLERIEGPEAGAGLVKHLLLETDLDVRQATMAALAKRNEPGVVAGLVQALGSKDPSVINRAAWALGQLGAVTTVPKLIPALVTFQYRFVMPPVQGWPSGNAGGSFGSVSPMSGLGGYPLNGVRTYGGVTPPVAAPGAVAYGATGIPTPMLPGATLNAGGGGGPREQMPRIITLRFQNVEVLATLVKLTGQDFGFDVPAWQRWVSTAFHPDPTPARRVPQP